MALNGTQWHSISISAPAFELVRGDEDRGAVDEPLVLRQLSEEFGRHLAAEDARVPDEGGFQGPSGVIRGHQSSSCRRRLPRTPCRHRHQSSVVISRHQSSSVVISHHQSSSVVILPRTPCRQRPCRHGARASPRTKGQEVPPPRAPHARVLGGT